jgi:hypothetical protein
MAAIGVFGSLIQAVGAMQQANAQSAEYKAKAAMNKRQAQIERIKGTYEADRLRDKGERIYGSQRAAYSDAGVTLEGTPTNVISESVSENQLDVQAVLWGQTIAGQNYDYQSKIDLMNAKSSKKAGFFAALSPILSGFSQLSSAYG